MGQGIELAHVGETVSAHTVLEHGGVPSFEGEGGIPLFELMTSSWNRGMAS